MNPVVLIEISKEELQPSALDKLMWIPKIQLTDFQIKDVSQETTESRKIRAIDNDKDIELKKFDLDDLEIAKDALSTVGVKE
jgi:hypothetical protein